MVLELVTGLVGFSSASVRNLKSVSVALSGFFSSVLGAQPRDKPVRWCEGDSGRRGTQAEWLRALALLSSEQEPQ